MDIFNKLTAHLDVEQLRELVKAAAEKESDRPVESITFNVESRCEGYGMNERMVQVFTGATIVFGKQTEQSVTFTRVQKK